MRNLQWIRCTGTVLCQRTAGHMDRCLCCMCGHLQSSDRLYAALCNQPYGKWQSGCTGSSEPQHSSSCFQCNHAGTEPERNRTYQNGNRIGNSFVWRTCRGRRCHLWRFRQWWLRTATICKPAALCRWTVFGISGTALWWPELSELWYWLFWWLRLWWLSGRR